MPARVSGINTGRTLHTAVALLCWASIAVGCAGSESRQSTGELVDDTVITTKVKTALIRSDQVDAIDIQIKTYKGVVQLSGFADTEQERRRADSIAGRIAGVERVQNDIRIKQ